MIRVIHSYFFRSKLIYTKHLPLKSIQQLLGNMHERESHLPLNSGHCLRIIHFHDIHCLGLHDLNHHLNGHLLGQVVQ